MGRRIRIVERKKESTFAERLEARAAAILARARNRDIPDPVMDAIAGEIALTLDQIRSVRRLHEHLRRELTRVECYIETEIIQREPRIPVYEDRRIAERDMLRGRLLAIGQERRRLAMAEEEKTHAAHSRLLMLTNRRNALTQR